VPRGSFGDVRRSGGMEMILMRDVTYRGRRPPETQ